MSAISNLPNNCPSAAPNHPLPLAAAANTQKKKKKQKKKRGHHLIMPLDMPAPTPPLPLAPRWIPKRGQVLKDSLKKMSSFLGLCFGK
jgi:hypothetical protein